MVYSANSSPRLWVWNESWWLYCGRGYSILIVSNMANLNLGVGVFKYNVKIQDFKYNVKIQSI